MIILKFLKFSQLLVYFKYPTTSNILCLPFFSVTDLTIFRVVAGEHSLNTVSGLEQNRDVVSFTMHENYRPLTFENDISLIFVS